MSEEVTRTATDEGVAPAEQNILPESSIPVIQEYNGRPTILLNPGARWPTSFGLAKARLVLQNVAWIQRFVDSNGTSIEQ